MTLEWHKASIVPTYYQHLNGPSGFGRQRTSSLCMPVSRTVYPIAHFIVQRVLRFPARDFQESPNLDSDSISPCRLVYQRKWSSSRNLDILLFYHIILCLLPVIGGEHQRWTAARFSVCAISTNNPANKTYSTNVGSMSRVCGVLFYFVNDWHWPLDVKQDWIA